MLSSNPTLFHALETEHKERNRKNSRIQARNILEIWLQLLKELDETESPEHEIGAY